MASAKSLLNSLLFRIRRRKLARLVGWHVAAAERLDKGQFEQASELFERILALLPDDVSALSGLAFIAAQRQDFGDAMRRWDAIVSRFPDDYWAAIGRGNTLIDSARFDEAEVAFEQALSRWPQRREALSGHATVAHRQRRFALAIARWETVLQRFADDDWATLNLGLDLMESGQYGRAETLLAALVGRCPDDLAALSGYAEVASRAHRYVAALQRWNAVLKTFPDDYPALIGSALALLKTGQFAAADSRFQQAVAVPNHDPTRLSLYPAALIETQRFDAALEAWARIASLYPDNARVMVSIGDSWFEMGDYRRATGIYLGAQARWPDDLQAFHSHARLLEKQRRDERFDERCVLSRQQREAFDCGGYVVCEQRKFMFVVIAGNASTALKRLAWSLDHSPASYSAQRPDTAFLDGFFDFSDDHLRRISNQQSRQQQYAAYLKFAVYRDPLDRLMAVYNQWICPTRSQTNHGSGYFQQLGVVDATLAEFVEFASAELSHQDPLRQDAHLRCQSLFYNPDEVDWIVPLPQLDAFLLTELGLSIAESPSQPGCHSTVASPQMAILKDIYARDYCLADCSNVYLGDGHGMSG